MAQFPAVIDLAALTGSTGTDPGFRIDGIDPTDKSGISVASAGDVNGDGFDDLVILVFGDCGSGAIFETTRNTNIFNYLKMHHITIQL